MHERRIGLWGAVATLVGYVIGASIFVLPAQLLPSTGAGVILSYLVAAIPAIFTCVAGAVVGNAFPVPVMGIYLGRERGDILFPDDGYVSGLHCQLTVTGNRVNLTDVGSSNGTYVRLRAPRSLRNGDFLLLGQQLFRLQAV